MNCVHGSSKQAWHAALTGKKKNLASISDYLGDPRHHYNLSPSVSANVSIPNFCSLFLMTAPKYKACFEGYQFSPQPCQADFPMAKIAIKKKKKLLPTNYWDAYRISYWTIL